MSDPVRLQDRPAWGYLLRDYYELYRRLSAGGSAKIRAHQRAVREEISRLIKGNAPVREHEWAHKPVLSHYRRAIDNGLLERHAHFVRAIDAISDHLTWQYGYDRVPRGLERKYAYAEIAGSNGPVVTDRIVLGLVLFAPACTYPAHAHDGICESYFCLSGTVSENDQGVYAPGSLIFNPPDQVHRITVADHSPALLCYAWQGTPDKLASQKMAFSRKSKKGG